MNKNGTQRFVIRAVVSGGAAALGAAWLMSPPELGGSTLVRAFVLLLLTIAAELLSFRLPHGDTSEQITLGEIAIAADVALLPAALSPVVAVAGLSVALAARRRPPVKVAYNAGQYALATVVASSIFHGFGGGDVESASGLAALFAGMTAFAASNLLTISAIIAAISGRALPAVIRGEFALSSAIALGNSSVGMVAVGLWLQRPLLLMAMLAPVLTLHLAYRGWIRQREFVGLMEDQKATLERIVEHSSEGIVLTDGEGTVLLWSPSMERITGVTEEEARGKSIGFLLRGRSASGAIRHVEAGGEDALIEITRADGAPRWLRVRHGPAHDAEALRWDVVVVHDVTAEHETEKMKEHFLATVSHELRTPLTPIIGYAKFLLRRPDVPEEGRLEALAAMVDRGEHMQRLVEDLILASSIDASGKMRAHARAESVDLLDVTGRVVRSVQAAHPDREITCEDEGAGPCIGDALRISQVLANLLDNAIKFSPPGSPVQVRLARESERVVVSVTDDGRGIPSDKLEQIFQKFRRLEDPVRMETSGAGLGLFIVDQLARAMGGSVEVRSNLGQGSTFTVRLPALSGQSADARTGWPRTA